MGQPAIGNRQLATGKSTLNSDVEYEFEDLLNGTLRNWQTSSLLPHYPVSS